MPPELNDADLGQPTPPIKKEYKPVGKSEDENEKKAMRQQLIEQDGCHYYPREKEVTIPLINDETLPAIVSALGITNEMSKDITQTTLKTLYSYLKDGEAITDRFGHDEDERMEWSKAYLSGSQREAFNSVYHSINQLKGDKFVEIVNSLYFLATGLMSTNPNMSESIYERGENLDKLQKNYAKIDLPEKRELINVFEHNVMEVLDNLPGITQKETIKIT